MNASERPSRWRPRLRWSLRSLGGVLIRLSAARDQTRAFSLREPMDDENPYKAPQEQGGGLEAKRFWRVLADLAMLLVVCFAAMFVLIVVVAAIVSGAQTWPIFKRSN